MEVLCPTCHGKGTVNDPKCMGKVMYYCDTAGNEFPQVICKTCNGTGWIKRISWCPTK